MTRIKVSGIMDVHYDNVRILARTMNKYTLHYFEEHWYPGEHEPFGGRVHMTDEFNSLTELLTYAKWWVADIESAYITYPSWSKSKPLKLYIR